MKNAEMPFIQGLPVLKFVDEEIVRSWKNKREAVLWCWEHRPKRGMNEPHDQSMCARQIGMYVSHISRCLNPRSKAPMELKSDYVDGFEQYTGWRGVSQFEMRDRGLTIMEEVIAQRAAA